MYHIMFSLQSVSNRVGQWHQYFYKILVPWLIFYVFDIDVELNYQYPTILLKLNQ